jgi:hypothetical protein
VGERNFFEVGTARGRGERIPKINNLRLQQLMCNATRRLSLNVSSIAKGADSHPSRALEKVIGA